MLNEIEAARAIVPQIRREWVDEIIVIDGGSTDGTVEYVQSQGLKVHSQTARGYGQECCRGCSLPRGTSLLSSPLTVTPCRKIYRASSARCRKASDLVIASRYLGGTTSEDDDWLTAKGNWLFTTAVNILFWANYTDVLVGFRAFRRDRALRLGFDTPGLSWPCQSSIRFARAGLKVTEISAREPARIGGYGKCDPSGPDGKSVI